MGHRPLIAVTTGHNMPDRPEMYIQALDRAGAMAEFIHPHIRKRGLVEHYDGFLIPGGRDISPSRYRERPICRIQLEDEKRTDFELLILREAAAKRLPVLGICYGMQLINVFFKGALIQDILSQVNNALVHEGGIHGISLTTNPYMPLRSYDVNSSHHQAVGRPGNGIIPFAFSSDGVVEAFFHSEQSYMVGVQWHPERMDNDISGLVFKSFVEACNERCK